KLKAAAPTAHIGNLNASFIWRRHADRQSANPFTGKSENRVGDGGRDRWDTHFSRAAHFIFAGHNVHLDLRHLVHPEHRIVVKVPLPHASFLEGDLAIQGSGEAKDDTTLHLSAYNVGVHHRAAINRADHAVD